ncbi:MAG: substrate-binding domain-containing protein, partial [Bacteroidales bacterium]|nr:substrate-binding domain-containing protein [Bacteroidales bacterium]
MVNFRNSIVFSLLIAVMIFFSGCGRRANTITISGAFALYPLMVMWAEEFRAENPHIQIDISAGGSGKGMTDVLANLSDIAMMSRSIHAPEIERGAIVFPVAQDAVVAIINTNNPLLKDILARGITQEIGEQIWIRQTIRTWGDFLEINHPLPMNVYTRADACGAAQVWASWFGKAQEDLGGISIFGDPGIVQAVQNDPNGIAFANLAFVYDFVTGLLNSNIAVIPIDSDGNGMICDAENFYGTREQIVDAINAGLMPSPPARNLYLVTNGIPTNPNILKFLKYIHTDGQRLNVPVGFVEISEKTAQETLELLKNQETPDNFYTVEKNNIVGFIVLFLALVALGMVLFHRKSRLIQDKIAGKLMLLLTLVTISLVLIIGVGLFFRSMPILSEHSLGTLLFSSEWQPLDSRFGFAPFLMGTLYVTLIGIVMALPISLLSAVYLTEFAKPRLTKYIYPVLDILAGIPSVIYGLWGVLVIVPFIGMRIAPIFGVQTV